MKKLAIAKIVSTKSAVLEHATITTDGKYYVCQYIIEDDE